MTICQDFLNWGKLTNKQRFVAILKIVITCLAITDLTQNIIEVVHFLNVPLDLFIETHNNGFYIISSAYSKSTPDRTNCYFFQISNITSSNTTSPTSKTSNSTSSDAYKIDSSDLDSIFNNNGVKWAFAAFDIAWLVLGLIMVITDLLDIRFPCCCLELSHKMNYIALLLMSLLTLPTRGLIVGYNLSDNCLGDSALIGFLHPTLYAGLTLVAVLLFVVLILEQLLFAGSLDRYCPDPKTKQCFQYVVLGIFGSYIVFGFVTIISSWGATPLAFNIIMIVIIFFEIIVVCLSPEHDIAAKPEKRNEEALSAYKIGSG